MSPDTQDNSNEKIQDTDPILQLQHMSDAQIRVELITHQVKPHHKMGIDKLRLILTQVREGTYVAPEIKPVAAPSLPVKPKVSAQEPTLAAKSAAAASKRMTKTQKAMVLHRIIVTPNDPLMSQYSGLIFTVGSSSVNNGRMVKKYVPFNNEAGWHVPNIIVENIQAAEMQKFRPATLPNGQKTSEAYIAKKYNVQFLDPLTQTEMNALAASQQALGGNR